MKYKKDAEGFIIISLTTQEIAEYNRESLQIWGKFALGAAILTLTIIGLVSYFS